MDMNQNTMGEDKGKSAMIVGGQTKSSFARSNDLSEQLLPGLPNEISLDVIATKLSWKDFYTLSRVSLCWQQAIQTRLVFDARVRSHSTETVVAVHKKFAAPTNLKSGIILYCMRDDSWCELPEVPCLSGIADSECVSLNGKIYVLGGGAEGPANTTLGRSTVYVLDLVGQRQWRQCATMQDPRLSFGASVLDGKIYVFGGISLGKVVCTCEVYDPKIDAWIRLNPMITGRFNHRVSTTGEALLVSGGRARRVFNGYFLQCFPNSTSWSPVLFRVRKHARPYYEVYHPGEDDWTSIKSSAEERYITERGFTAEGNMPPYEYSFEPLSCLFRPGDDLFSKDSVEPRGGLAEYPEHLEGESHIRFEIGPWCGLAADRLYVGLGLYTGGRGLPYSYCGWGLLRNSGLTWRVAKFYPSIGVSYSVMEGKCPFALFAVQL